MRTRACYDSYEPTVFIQSAVEDSTSEKPDQRKNNNTLQVTNFGVSVHYSQL